jgi:hypothetical protein
MLGITKHAYSTISVLPTATPHRTASEANDIWDSIHPGLKAGWKTYRSPTLRIKFNHNIARHIIYDTHEPTSTIHKYNNQIEK